MDIAKWPITIWLLGHLHIPTFCNSHPAQSDSGWLYFRFHSPRFGPEQRSSTPWPPLVKVIWPSLWEPWPPSWIHSYSLLLDTVTPNCERILQQALTRLRSYSELKQHDVSPDSPINNNIYYRLPTKAPHQRHVSACSFLLNEYLPNYHLGYWFFF